MAELYIEYPRTESFSKITAQDIQDSFNHQRKCLTKEVLYKIINEHTSNLVESPFDATQGSAFYTDDFYENAANIVEDLMKYLEE